MLTRLFCLVGYYGIAQFRILMLLLSKNRKQSFWFHGLNAASLGFDTTDSSTKYFCLWATISNGT